MQLDAESANRLAIEEKLKGVIDAIDRREVSSRPERPPKFFGRENDRADTWLFLNKQYFVTTGLAANVKQCILLAASGFRGNAAVWWEHVVRQLEQKSRPEMTTWEQFEDAVKAEFQPLDSEKAARDILADLVQTRSVTAYVGVVRDLALQIPDLSMGDLLHKFTRGLKPHIRRDVELRDPKTLDEAIRMAERADVIETSNKWRRPNQGNFLHGGQRTFQNNNGMGRQPPVYGQRPQQSRYNGPQPMELGAMRAVPGRSTGNNWSERRPRDYSQVVCWNCQQKGHTASRCRNQAAPKYPAKERRQQ